MKDRRVDSFLKAHAIRCAYCGTVFNFGYGKTIDHIVPQSHDAKAQKGTNKVVVCKDCNLKKGATRITDFRKIVDKQNILDYLESFGDMQLPTGEHYANAIKKKFHINF